MSTGIFFKKQFIKVNNEYVPMVLSGSSNCFDYGKNGGNGRISRDWGNMSYHCGGKLSDTADNILASVDTCFNETVNRCTGDNGYDNSTTTADEVKNSYGWYVGLRVGNHSTSKTSFNIYRSLYVDGFKKALTIEQLRLKGVTVRLKAMAWDKDKFAACGLKLRDDAFMYSTDQFEAAMNEWESYYGDNANIYICYGSEGELERMFKDNRKVKVQKVKEPKTVNSCYVIKHKVGDRYFMKRTKTKTILNYNVDAIGVKKYLSEKAALSKLKTFNNSDEYQVVYKTFDAPIYI